MKEKSLKERLSDWLVNHPKWHASGDLQRMVTLQTSYTAANVSRRLRELENEGAIEVDYRKGHAYYRAVPKAASMEEWFDQLPSDRTEKLKFGARDFAQRFEGVMRDLAEGD